VYEFNLVENVLTKMMVGHFDLKNSISGGA